MKRFRTLLPHAFRRERMMEEEDLLTFHHERQMVGKYNSLSGNTALGARGPVYGGGGMSERERGRGRGRELREREREIV